jgi:hypothetical protein
MFLSFHCISWCMTSILRYLYILHSNWINVNFEDQRKLSALSLLFVFVTFIAVMVPLGAVLVSLGKTESQT